MNVVCQKTVLVINRLNSHRLITHAVKRSTDSLYPNQYRNTPLEYF
jgi:hypothetical protein